MYVFCWLFLTSSIRGGSCALSNALHCDRMLDMGFEPQIKKILLDIQPDRQTHVRLEAKHEPTYVNRRGGGAAMFLSSIFLYSPRCDGGFMHLLSTEESHNKLNPRSTTTHGQTCCFACSCYGPLPPSAVACAKIAQIILGSPAQSGDPRFAQ